MAAKGAWFNNSVNAAVRVASKYAEVDFISLAHANSSDCWLQMFDANTLSSVTLGTTTPDYSLPIPASASGVRGKFTHVFHQGHELIFPTGLVIALTTTSKGSTGITLKGVVNLRVMEVSYGHTYPELRQLVYDKAGVSSSHALLSLTKNVNHIWRAQLQMVRAALAAGIVPVNLRKEADLDLAVSNPHYLPADMMQLLQLRAKSATGTYTTIRMRTSERWDEEEQTWEDSTPYVTDGPMVYVLKGVENSFGSNYGKLKCNILPVPTVAVTGGLRCRYVRNPMPFSDFTGTNSTNVIVDIPGEFHEDLAHGAVWEFLTNNPSVPRQDYDKHRQIFEAATQAYVAMQGEQNQIPYEGSFGSAIFGLLDNYHGSL